MKLQDLGLVWCSRIQEKKLFMFFPSAKPKEGCIHEEWGQGLQSVW